MALSIRFILLICILGITRAQYSDGDGGTSGQKIRAPGRFLPRQTGRSHPQPSIPNQRFRRPIPLRSIKPASEANDFPTLTAVRPKPTFLPTIKPDNPSTPPPQSLQQDQPIKPVSEETKEEDDDVNQTLVKHGQFSSSFPQQSSNNFGLGTPITPKPEPIFQYRPAQAFSKPLIQLQEENITPVQYRPAKPIKFRKPVEDIPEVRVPVKQQSLVRQSPRNDYKVQKKPVAQVIRRWREDNEDGSITWGFENDDGSFKEEIIGIDCVTRGKYGYIDPDGNRREYSYETGIKCDEEQQEEDNGFVDYQENKLVFSNGKTIDLSSMGKKQARRPQHIYRN